MPSLKEVNAGDPVVAAAGRGTVAGAIPHVVSSTSDGSNEATAVAAPNSQKMPPAPKVEREDPANVPDDETAFLVGPHFSGKNPFHRDLSEFDLSMRCPICKELFNAPVSLYPCLHSFCSLCVRDHLKREYTGMKRKADCPQCKAPVKFPGSSDYEKGILPNQPLEVQVDAYKKCRSGLRESLVNLDVLQKEKELGILAQLDGDEETSGKMGGRARGGRASKRERRAVSKDTSCASRSDEEVDDDDDDEDYDDDSSDSKMPASSGQAVSQPTVVVQHKATVSYHGMSKKKLVALCQKEGLETHGNEGELKKRHSDFIILHNSECDSAHPRSVQELRKVIRSRERAITREAKDVKQKKESKHMTSLGSSLEAYHKGEASKPTSGNAKFDAMMSNNFARMIKDVKKREGKSDGTTALKSNGDTDEMVPECVKKCTAAASAQQMEGATGTSATNGDAVDSDETVETPRKPRAKRSTTTKPAVKRQASAKKAKPSSKANTPRVTRVKALGPWQCKACTFVNKRNVTKNARCEMCNNVRPEPSASDQAKKQADDEDVIEIDC
ncbi:hypothetical protein ACHAXT_009214 [Thalassiosira profunda]